MIINKHKKKLSLPLAFPKLPLAIPQQGVNHSLMSKQFHLTSLILSLFKILQLSDTTFLSPAMKFVWGLLFRSPAHGPFTTIHVIFLNDFLHYATSTFPIMHLICPLPPPPPSPLTKKDKNLHNHCFQCLLGRL